MGVTQTLRDDQEKYSPPKVRVIGQLAYEVITNEEAIEPVPNVEVVLHADGFGTSERRSFKLFNEQHVPLISQ